MPPQGRQRQPLPAWYRCDPLHVLPFALPPHSQILLDSNGDKFIDIRKLQPT